MQRFCNAALISILFTTTASAADVLTLSDGRTLSGEYIGGGRASISFRVGERVERFALTQVDNLRFDPLRERQVEGPAEALTNARIVTTGDGLQALRIQPMDDTAN